MHHNAAITMYMNIKDNFDHIWKLWNL